MWTEKDFINAYEEYLLDSRQNYLYKRTEYLMTKYYFGQSTLLYGGAMGWGGLPLLKEGKFVYNYDTSDYICNLANYWNEPLKPFKTLPENYTFETIFFEDSLTYYSAAEKVQYIIECLKYKPTLILILESSDEIEVSKEVNKNIIKGLKKIFPSAHIELEYYNTGEFTRNLNKHE